MRYIINTHYHHARANHLFGSEVSIIAHKNTRLRMQRETKMYDLVPIGPWPEEALPEILVTDTLNLEFNNERVEIIHFPKVHTDGDLVIYFTESNVVHTGDFFVPFKGPCDVANGGNWENLIEGLDALIEFLPDDVKIIPGHGRVSTIKDVKEYGQMLEEVTSMIRQKLKRGISKEQIIQEGLPSKWRNWNDTGISSDFFIQNATEGILMMRNSREHN